MKSFIAGGAGYIGCHIAHRILKGDYITLREVADLVICEMGLEKVKYTFSGGDRGWKGDVPIVR